MTVITSPDVLTQDILDRCARRAPDYDRENRFFHEDFEELKLPATCSWRCRWSSAVSACRSPRSAGRPAGSPTTPRPPRSRRTCTSTGPASRPTCTATATGRLTWLLEGGGRGRECSPPGTAKRATTCRVLLSTVKAEPVEGRLPVHRPQDVRFAEPGVDTPRDPRDGHERSRQARRSVHTFMPRRAEGYVDQRDVGHARHAGDAQ